MLRIVSYDSFGNTETVERVKIMEPRKDKGDESAITLFDIRNGVILTRRALSTPDLPP